MADGSGAPAQLEGWPAVIGALSEYRDLSPEAASWALSTVLAGQATDGQIAAFAVALRMKGETVDEMVAMVEAMRAAATPLSVDVDAVDIVGTGGASARRRAALNVSTMACFVVAGAGAVVCKHGNRAASSTSGSFDLLELLGIPTDLEPVDVERCVVEAGIGFAFARTFHPAMRHAAPARAQIGVPTVFNLLGPLCHPGRVRRQVVGVTDAAQAERVLGVLGLTGSVHAMVVSGDGALDELSTTGPSTVLELRADRVHRYQVTPEELGLGRAEPADLAGGGPEANAEIARRVLAGEPGPARDVVVLNAAAGLVVAGRAKDLAEGVAAARASIDAGAARAKLAELVEVATRRQSAR